MINGGEGGIRTHDTLASMPHFECGAFDLSATSPGNVKLKANLRGGSLNRSNNARKIYFNYLFKSQFDLACDEQMTRPWPKGFTPTPKRGKGGKFALIGTY